MNVHELKMQKQFWHALDAEEKTVEVRLNDRDFQKGDVLRIQPLDENGDFMKNPNGTWKCFNCYITHVLYFPEGLQKDYVALSIKRLSMPIKDYLKKKK